MALEIIKGDSNLHGSEAETHRHPAFGMIQFSRINGGGHKFFGSDLKQDHFIELKIEQAEVTRSLSKDWYSPSFGNKNRGVVRVRMTSNQFSELITSLNIGSGVPCTIESIKGEKVEEIPKDTENRKDFVHKSFKERMTDFAQRFSKDSKNAKTIIEKKTLTKQDQHDLLHLFESIQAELTNNIPFFMKCFQETSDKIVTEAKQEVENAILHKLTSLGFESIKNSILENKSEEVKQIES